MWQHNAASAPRICQRRRNNPTLGNFQNKYTTVFVRSGNCYINTLPSGTGISLCIRQSHRKRDGRGRAKTLILRSLTPSRDLREVLNQKSAPFRVCSIYLWTIRMFCLHLHSDKINNAVIFISVFWRICCHQQEYRTRLQIDSLSSTVY